MMMNVDTRDEFWARHGQGEKPVKRGGVLLFPTGACCSVDDEGRGEGSRQEPPTDPIELLKAKREYARAKANELRKEFIEKKEHWGRIVLAAVDNPLSYEVTAENLEEVKALQERHNYWCDRMADLDRELTEMPEQKAANTDQEERAILAQQRSLRFMDLHAKLNELTLKSPPIEQERRSGGQHIFHPFLGQ